MPMRDDLFSVKGDGVSNLEQLIDLKHKALVDSGRDIHFERQLPIIMNKLEKMGLSMTDIIPEGRRCSFDGHIKFISRRNAS